MPVRAISASRSAPRPVAACTAASSRALPGPRSPASTSSAPTRVRLEIPPMFSTAVGTPPVPSSSWSSSGASGAPCPPAATSAVRRSQSTGREVASAIREASPIWSVARTVPSSVTSWWRVWPWVAIRSAPPCRASTAAAAPAKASPTAACRRFQAATSAGAGGSTARSASWVARGQGSSPVWSTRARRVEGSAASRVKSTSATSIPSRLVPDIIPSTRISARLPAGRRRRRASWCVPRRGRAPGGGGRGRRRARRCGPRSRRGGGTGARRGERPPPRRCAAGG